MSVAGDSALAQVQVRVRPTQAQAQTMPQKWVPDWASQLRLSAHPRAQRGPLAANLPPKKGPESAAKLRLSSTPPLSDSDDVRLTHKNPQNHHETATGQDLFFRPYKKLLSRFARWFF